MSDDNPIIFDDFSEIDPAIWLDGHVPDISPGELERRADGSYVRRSYDGRMIGMGTPTTTNCEWLNTPLSKETEGRIYEMTRQAADRLREMRDRPRFIPVMNTGVMIGPMTDLDWAFPKRDYSRAVPKPLPKSGNEPALSRPQDDSPMLSSAVREKRIAEVRSWVVQNRSSLRWLGFGHTLNACRIGWLSSLWTKYKPYVAEIDRRERNGEIQHWFDVVADEKGKTFIVTANLDLCPDLPVESECLISLIVQVYDWLTELERADHE